MALYSMPSSSLAKRFKWGHANCTSIFSMSSDTRVTEHRTHSTAGARKKQIYYGDEAMLYWMMLRLAHASQALSCIDEHTRNPRYRKKSTVSKKERKRAQAHPRRSFMMYSWPASRDLQDSETTCFQGSAQRCLFTCPTCRSHARKQTQQT